MNQTPQIARILSGSCTPACDLLALVKAGQLTEWDATRALRTLAARSPDVRTAAAEEIAYMRDNDL